MIGGNSMKFFNIADTSAFLQKVLDCKGNVYCKDASGELRDLKQAAQLLCSCNWLSRPERLDEIDIVVEQNSDSCLLFRYMQEAVCTR